ncbi:hypothetical protein PAEVO_29890 [Paenibacillus sp. GM2FR]|uniref:histidine phosphatase family protein n=1 Tax=Paenibacillus sp. GM2FR TaxID=2059268 RepID=UPI000C273B8C|nr:histidine phosphatase family protein [Paenibacillus sp. GM2FR]PJN56266.1 hypothetical protein PAEVO_29890 [Paenibacillus sp. GM2FR]
MTTFYFVRHAESPFIVGKERLRGLSAEGSLAAVRVKELLLGDTVQPLADALGLPIAEQEDLRERNAGDFQGHSFLDAKKILFQDPATSFPGGESSKTAQSRAVQVLEEILNTHIGKRVVIGTHGDIMTLMLQHYDQRFDYQFWQGMTLPDIYRVEFEEGRLANIARLWSEQ